MTVSFIGGGNRNLNKRTMSHKYTVTKEKSNAHPLTIKNKIKINTYIELGLPAASI